MRIGIDVHSAEIDGTGNCTFIRHLVSSLVAIDRDNTYYLYVTDAAHPFYRRFGDIANVRIRTLANRFAVSRVLEMGFRSFGDGLDILHMQYMLPPLYRGKAVLSVYDLGFLYHPECFSRWEYQRLRMLLPFCVKRADRVVTISKNSRLDILRHYRLPRERCENVGAGVDRAFRFRPDADRAPFEGKYGIRGPFILYVGRINARKNVTTLMEAYLKLREEGKIPHQLVVVGRRDFLPKPLKAMMERSGRSDGIIFTGTVSDGELPLFYNLADVFVYPSLYEGFGLPCLEAMSSGCPVISSDRSSIPEVVGDAGTLIDPLDSDAMYRAIESVLTDEAALKNHRTMGLERSRRFSWQKTAERVLGVYRSVDPQQPFPLKVE